MQVATRMVTFFLFVSALAYAETWTGKLIDAKCAEQQENAACSATTSTTSFALRVSEKMYKFDAEGNTKAAEALKNSESGAERLVDPESDSSDTGATAKVSGTLSNDEIKVDSIEIQ